MKSNTAPNGWLHKADIAWILHKKDISNSDKAGRICKILGQMDIFTKGCRFFTAEESGTVLADVVSASRKSHSEFENAVEVLYAFCDYNSVWLAS